MNNTYAVLLWAMINFVWSGILVLASGWLYSISRRLERDRETYQRFIRKYDQNQRNQRKL